jgi:hypothetical protein
VVGFLWACGLVVFGEGGRVQGGGFGGVLGGLRSGQRWCNGWASKKNKAWLGHAKAMEKKERALARFWKEKGGGKRKRGGGWGVEKSGIMK